jgi:hypothetical protein
MRFIIIIIIVITFGKVKLAQLVKKLLLFY